MSQSQTSPLWPVLKRSAKLLDHVKIPGTELTFAKVIDILAGIQDDMTQNQWQDDIKQALNGVLDHTGELVKELHKLNEELSAEELSEGMLELTERHYRRTMANLYLYVDFKGIEQDVRFESLELDAVFVALRLLPEHLDDRDREAGQALRERLLEVGGAEQTSRLQELVTLDAAVQQLTMKPLGTSSQPIDQVLSAPGGAVMLGGPGSGKTTLIKRLARSCALGQTAMQERYPALPDDLFPVVISITLYNAWRCDGQGVWDYIKDRLHSQGGAALRQVFERFWKRDRCLLLLDGLDEIAQADHRIGSARAVETLYQELHGNRALTTSRIVGYNICRLLVPADHVVLQSFGREDIQTFVRQWHVAREKRVHREAPNLQQAAQEAESLLSEIEANPNVRDLATNPLMLTIIALIKQRDVKLPERRVELYESAINTLLRGWNKARSLSGLTLGAEPRLEQTKRVWAAVAYWMHEQTSRPLVPPAA